MQVNCHRYLVLRLFSQPFLNKLSLLTLLTVAIALVASACTSSQSGLNPPSPSSAEADLQTLESDPIAEPTDRVSSGKLTGQTSNQLLADGSSFEQAVIKATNATELAAVAQTVDDWQRITKHWQEAITLLRTIPAADEQYAIAQQRLTDYQQQLKAAQQQATQYKQRIKQGKQLFQKMNGSYQLINVLQGTPAMQVVVLDEQWKALSKAEQINLVEYTKSLVQSARSAPEEYVDVSDTNPIYDRFISKATGLCDDCWQIAVGEQPSISSFSQLQAVVQGDELWEKEDPCCRGKKVSELVR